MWLAGHILFPPSRGRTERDTARPSERLFSADKSAGFSMNRLRLRLAVASATLLALGTSIPAAAQEYFGRNKVQYESFPWKILKSDHFDNFFYPSESLIVHDAGRM